MKVKDITGWTNVHLRDNRYDAIVHMVTAADGMPQYYNLEDNHRYETVEEAINIDKRLRTAYTGHNKVFMI